MNRYFTATLTIALLALCCCANSASAQDDKGYRPPVIRAGSGQVVIQNYGAGNITVGDINYNTASYEAVQMMQSQLRTLTEELTSTRMEVMKVQWSQDRQAKATEEILERLKKAENCTHPCVKRCETYSHEAKCVCACIRPICWYPCGRAFKAKIGCRVYKFRLIDGCPPPRKCVYKGKLITRPCGTVTFTTVVDGKTSVWSVTPA